MSIENYWQCMSTIEPWRRLCRIKMFVLDEADEMLSRGFKDQIYDIFQLMPPNLQVHIASSSPSCQPGPQLTF